MMLIVGHPCWVHDREDICQVYSFTEKELAPYFSHDPLTIGCCYYLPHTKPPLDDAVRENLCQHPEIERRVCALLLGRVIRNRQQQVTGICTENLLVDPAMPETHRVPLKRRVVRALSTELARLPDCTATFAVEEYDNGLANILKTNGWGCFRQTKGLWWFRYGFKKGGCHADDTSAAGDDAG